MKVIDLLNRIANGEEVSKKIKIKQWENNAEDEDLEYELFDRLYNEDFELNDEVEVIEEDKKIEKLELVSNGSKNSYALLDEYGTKCALTKHSKIMCDKINEIIDKINKEDNNGN